MSSTDQPALGLVGAGRAGSALALAFHEAGYPVTAVHSRTPQHARRVADATGATICASPADAARLSEILFLVVPDAAVREVAQGLASAGALRGGGAIVHCSGSVPRSELDAATAVDVLTGVFHPLQALAGPRSARLLRGSSIGIEAGPDLAPVLRSIAADLGATPIELQADGRIPYHIAAVLAGNWTLVLLAAATDLMTAAGVSDEAALHALLPLAHGSLVNLGDLGPRDGLTGPVIRGDVATVRRHMEYLRGRDPNMAETYRRLGLLALDLAGEGTANREDVRWELEA